MVMPLGTKVKQGEILAVKPGFLGRKIEVRAKNDGTLESLSALTGELTISTSEDQKPPKKPQLTPKIDLESKKPVKSITSSPEKENSLKGIYGFGEGSGELVFCNDCLTLGDLKPELEGKVVCGISLEGNAAIFKASALGIKAIALLSLAKAEVNKIKNEIDGKTGLGFLVFGESEDKKLTEKLKKLVGREVKVDGAGLQMLF